MSEKPESPADPRPNDEPYYIDNECEECGSELVLYDEESGWNDEFICPECEDGVYMDWPDSMYEEMKRRAQEESDEALTPLEVTEDVDL